MRSQTLYSDSLSTCTINSGFSFCYQELKKTIELTHLKRRTEPQCFSIESLLRSTLASHLYFTFYDEEAAKTRLTLKSLRGLI